MRRKGYIEYLSPRTGHARIRIARDEFFVFWPANLAPDQQDLRIFLERGPNGMLELRPLVSFEVNVEECSGLAWNVSWEESGKVWVYQEGADFTVLNGGLPRDRIIQWVVPSDAVLIKGTVYQILGGTVIFPTDSFSSFEVILENTNLQNLIVNHLSNSGIDSLLNPFAEFLKDRLGNNWETFEQHTLSPFPPLLVEAVRERILKGMNETELYRAWRHQPNRSTLRRLFPDRTQRWTVTDILKTLQMAAVDIEVRHGAIQEIGLCDSYGIAPVAGE